MSVVQGGLAAIVGLAGVVVGQTLKLDVAVSLLVGIVLAGVGFVAAGALIPAGAAPVATTRKAAGGKKDKSEKKPKKEKEPKAKKAVAAAPPPEEEEEEEEEQPKPVEKAKKKKKGAKDEPAAPTPAPAPAAAAAGKKGKAAAAVPVPVKVESESEEEEEVAAPKSKSALKKAKAKAAALKKEAEEKAAALAAAAAAAAAEAAAKLAAAAEGGKKKKKKAAAEEAPAPKQTKPTKEEKANLEEGEWELPSHSKRSKKQEEAKAAKAASNKANSAAAVTTDEKSNQSYAEIKVDVKQLGVLIGTGGATLKLIQEETKTKIDVPKKDSGSSIVKITGQDPESVSRAQGTIESLLTRGFSSITHPGEIQDDIFIATEQIGAVVGTGGNILKVLQKATDTVIKIPQKSAETSRPGGEKGVRATITGAKDNVKAAKAAIKSLIADGFSPLTNPGWEKVELAFPKEKIPLLIGLKGHTIKSIQGNTGTRINISPEKVVSVVGTEADIRQAVKEINRLLEPVGGYAPEDEDWVQDEVEAQGTWGFKSTAVQGEEALWD